MRNLKLTLCLSIALSTAAAYAQVLSSDVNGNAQAATSNSPVAYIYVSSTNNSTNEIVAYAAAANGRLSAVSGSPFPDNVSVMAVNGKYLMAATNSNPPDIDTLRIGSNGALTYVTSTPCVQKDNQCVYAFNLFFDHTGSDLYVMDSDGSNDNTASFAVDESSGALNYLGDTISGAFPGDATGTFFIGDNIYAYSADQEACLYPGLYGYQRESSGLLNFINNFKSNNPTPPPGVSTYYPDLAVADATNHLAIIEQPANPPGCANGPLQLATYTVKSNGNIHTNSTYKDMPATLIKSPYDMKMSPSGKLLAVAGQEGLQVFHFNGANPVTHYTGLLTKEPISQMFWDNNDHLYAISQSSGKLFVYTITPTGHQMAPGSPYTISSPDDIIVQPLK
jgi:6-phosphogluconolactonase (cycloisomerase 2 family)